MQLGDYHAEWRMKIRNATHKYNVASNGMVPQTFMTGQSCPISDIAKFGWYEWVYYCDEP